MTKLVPLYTLHANQCPLISQVKESVAEEEVHSKERIPHHFTRHSKKTCFGLCALIKNCWTGQDQCVCSALLDVDTREQLYMRYFSVYCL